MALDGKQLAVRLSLEELSALRTIPAKTDAERLRVLIQTEAVSGGLARQIAQQLQQSLPNNIAEEVSSRVSADFNKALGEFIRQLNVILSKR